MQTAAPPIPQPRVVWRKDRAAAREGFKDLSYLPPGRAAWNATLAAHAWSARRCLTPRPDFGLWAATHNLPLAAHHAAMGDHAFILWHGTSAARVAGIREHGLFRKQGVWAAFEPTIAHGFARGRAAETDAGSAMAVRVVDRRTVREGVDYSYDGPEIICFHASLAPDCIAYLLLDDRIEFLGGEKAREPKPWGVARFKRVEGRWTPLSHPPVRFDSRRMYATLDEWIELSIRRILAALGRAGAIEVFSSLYATIEPWDALTHDAVFAAIERLCDVRQGRRGQSILTLKDGLTDDFGFETESDKETR